MTGRYGGGPDPAGEPRSDVADGTGISARAMAGLAIRLALAGRRDSVARLLVTAAGLALGTLLLLLGAVAFPALHAHAQRAAWTRTSAHNTRPAPAPAGTSPLLWQVQQDHFAGQPITWVNVAALGPRPPLPPGLHALPGPGQISVSPALARLLVHTPAAELRDRFPAARAVSTVGDAALASPGQLIVFQGWSPGRLAHRRGVDKVTSIETAPGGSPVATGFLRLMVLVGLAGLLVPVAVFILTATRLAAATRERRLAALRLAGATPRQVGAVAAAEAAVAAIPGTVAGFTLFTLLRPIAARIPVDGSAFFPSDLRLPVLAAVVIAAGVPALATLVAVAALRRVRISPLGVARRSVRPRPRARRLLPLAAGLAVFIAGMAWVGATKAASNAPLALVALAVVLIIVGIVAAGPLLTVLVAQLVSRLGRRAPALLAARHLEGNPVGGFRAVSGLVLATFVVTVISGVIPGSLAASRTGYTAFPAGLVVQEFALPGPVTGRAGPGAAAGTGLSPVAGRALLSRLAAVPGVLDVTGLWVPPARTAQPPGGDYPSKYPPFPVVGSCAGLRSSGLADCPPGAATGMVNASALADGSVGGPRLTVLHPVPAAALARLPLAAVAVRTSGATAAVERVRTILDAGPAGMLGPAETSADINAAANAKLSRLAELADAALLITLIIAGCSLATGVAGGLLERRQPLALLRLAGVRRSELSRMVLAESAVPLLALAVVSVGLGLGVAAGLLTAAGQGGNVPWKPPGPAFWLALAAGLTAAVALAAATLPLLHRLTALDQARFE